MTAEREARSKLERHTLLRLAPRVRITVIGDALLVEGEHDAVECSASLLPLLERLRQPSTLEAALSGSSTGSAHDFMDVAARVVDLVGAGALLAGSEATVPQASDHGFGYMEPHIGMLADEQRTAAYVAAIRRTVQPGDVVLDLGT